jgi:hypothetical protein
LSELKNKNKKAPDSLRVSLDMPCIWVSGDEVEFEVIKTEVLVFNRRQKVLKASKCVTISIAEQTFAIKQGATKWLCFWLDSKLSSKAEIDNRMADTRKTLQRVASLSRRTGDLCINMVQRSVVAAVASVALYGSEIW